MKKLTLTILAILLCVMAQAVPFLIGAYAQYDLPNSGNHSDLKAKLLEAGYNATTITVTKDNLFGDNNLQGVLSAFGDSVKTILSDQYWSYREPPTGSEKVGLYNLTYGNYLEMEAEYMYNINYNDNSINSFVPDSLTTLNDNGQSDIYNYIFAHYCGERTDEGYHSNQYAWVCDQASGHQAGLALSNPRFRWKTYSSNTYPRSIGRDFKFYQPALKDNYLYLTVAMKFSDLNAPDTIVATVGLKALKGARGRSELSDFMKTPASVASNYHNFELAYVNNSVSEIIYGNNAYYLNAEVERDDYQNFLFEYKVKLPDPINQADLYNDLMVNAGDGNYFLHIVPEVYWHGNGKMELDYIILEDEYHRQVRQGGTGNKVYPMMNARLGQIEELTNHGNIIYHLTKDEPHQGQFSMYNRVEDYLGSRANLITPANLEGHTVKKIKRINTDGPRYEHYIHFLKQATPKTIAVDAYPIGEWGTEKIINWNNKGDTYFVQKNIDYIVAETYHSLAQAVKGDSAWIDAEIVYIPQIYGDYEPKVPGNIQSGVREWGALKPPLSMIKCLQFLPLCYSADGILDFTLLARDTMYGGEFRIAPLRHDRHYGDLHVTEYNSAYKYLTEANQKIAIYGPYLSGLNWKNADCLMTMGGSNNVNLSNFYLTSLNVIDPYDVPRGGEPIPILQPYSGYVQCGYYMDNQLSPTFMLVNRRAVYRTTAANNPVGHNTKGDFVNVDSEFENAPSQTVNFVPSSGAISQFGTHIALYDRYDGELYREGDSGINVSVGPGDGKMLEMCSSLPPVVTSDADLKTLSYLAGDIRIDQGAEVTIHTGTNCTILPNSSILVRGGSTLHVKGNVIIGNDVTITVESGSNIIFDNADCEWGEGSILIVRNSSFDALSTDMHSNSTWEGLRINNAGTFNMSNSTISNANLNQVNDTKVNIVDCDFNVPPSGGGLHIHNTQANQDATITHSTFTSVGQSAGSGLTYDIPNSRLKAYYTSFDGFWLGLGNCEYSAVTDSIIGCTFANSYFGIYPIGMGYTPLIEECNFYNNEIGIYLEMGCSPKINECSFVACDIGIRTDHVTSSTGGIFNNVFSYGDYDIVSRGSNQRVAGNKFYGNYGILNHSGSRLNMVDRAKNLFKNTFNNLMFQDSFTYNAHIQLYNGHNDFYQKNKGVLNPSMDFHFDSNWYVSPPPKSNAINANYNWFEDMIVKISCPGVPSSYVRCTYMDPSPNVFLENPQRMAMALEEESDGNYLVANEVFKQVLNEDLAEESDLLVDALDAYYRTAVASEFTNTSIDSYLSDKHDQYAQDNPPLGLFIEDYIIHNYVRAEDYQSAIDRLEQRVLNATCATDSLHAVMDLEIVLQLAAQSGTKKPIGTKLAQYQYPTLQVYRAKHEEHWQLLDELLSKKKDANNPIPLAAQISSNYPNPFNPSTTIAFSIPKDGLVKIDVYNIKGQKVKELCNTEMQRGHHKIVWNGKDKHHRSVSSGVYFVRLQANGQTSTRKVMLMK